MQLSVKLYDNSKRLIARLLGS